ncbi:hypothetical protein NBRC10512v2_007769 [Rhodotorula toruloides]
MAAQPLANPLDDSAQYLSRPVPATNDAIDSSLPQSAVPSILVSPASPMAPSLGTPRLGPEAGGGRKVEPERGEEEEVRVGRDEAGENGQQGQARNWRNWAGKSPARQTAKLPPTSSSSSSPPAANRHPSSPPASSSRPPRISPSSPPSSFPSSSSTASNARQPPSEARTFFASLASSIPSVSLPSFSLSSLLPSRLPGAPHFEIQEGGFSSDEEEEEDEDDLEDGERRKELGGQKEGKQKEVLMRQSMDLRIEDATDGPSVVSDKNPVVPSPASASPSGAAPSSPARPAFAPLARTPSSAFVAASKEGLVHPLTMHAIARRDSEQEAIRVVRAREATERKRESSVESDSSVPGGAGGKKMPALLREQSWTARASSGLARSESPTQMSDEDGMASGASARQGSLRRKKDLSGSALGLGLVHEGAEDETGRQASGATITPSTAIPSAATGGPASVGSAGASGTSTPNRSSFTHNRSVSTASSRADPPPPLSAASIKAPKKSFLSRFGRNRTASSSSAPPREMRESTPPMSASSASGAFSPTSVDRETLDSPTMESTPIKAEKGAAKGEKIQFAKVKTKGKPTKAFGKLFLAQELVFPSASSSSSRPSAAAGDDDSLHSRDETASQRSGNDDGAKGTKKKNAIWTIKFSEDGKYLATGGVDGVVRVWEVLSTPEAREAALNSQTSPTADSSAATPGAPDSPTITRSGGAPATPTSTTAAPGLRSKKSKSNLAQTQLPKTPVCVLPVFAPKPIREFKGHDADVLDLSWSKNNFLLSSSMDKTVRLWHISRDECLCAFQHLDFVTSIAFHPRDDRFFLSGSLDCKLRLWNIPEKRVHIWTEVPDLITSVAFTRDGQRAIAGTFGGSCMFFDVGTLHYHTHFTAKSTRGKNARGKKVTCLCPYPLPSSGGERLLVTTNDSRIRLYHTADKMIEAKYAGHENMSSQIRASFSDDGRWIISGSEDRNVYIWESGMAPHENEGFRLSKKRKDGAGVEFFPMSAHIVTAAIFAPTMTRSHLAAAHDPIFDDGHSHFAPLDRTLSGASLGLAGVTSRATTIESTLAAGGLTDGEVLVPATSREGQVVPGAGGAEDAIIVVADAETSTISVFRNSSIPVNAVASTLAAPTSGSKLSRGGSKRWSLYSDGAR